MTLENAGFMGIARSLRDRLGKDPRLTTLIVLGLLLVANLVAAGAVLKPWGGSPEELQRQLAQLRRQARQRETAVRRYRALVETVEKTRSAADQFFERYFLDSQTAYSTVLAELNGMTERAGVRQRDHSVSYEPIEGSETLAMMAITGNYEGAYADLIQFVNLIDRSPRFLTIERLQAAPLTSQATLAINLRLNVFVRGEGTPK